MCFRHPKRCPEKEEELEPPGPPLLGSTGLKSQPSSTEIPTVLTGDCMRIIPRSTLHCEHAQHLLLPSEDSVLLIQVSTGAKCDEAGESTWRSGKQQAGPPSIL